MGVGGTIIGRWRRLAIEHELKAADARKHKQFGTAARHDEMAAMFRGRVKREGF